MILICGNATDTLVQELLVLSRKAPFEVEHLDEGKLFGTCSFALTRQGQRTQGFLELQRGRLSLNDLHGVVLRLPRVWWPSEEFDLQDQMFVFHETVASWFALFDTIQCPVINRYGLGWWLQDLGYPVELRASLAAALRADVCDVDEPNAEGGRLWPTQRDTRDSVESIYRSGGLTVPTPGCGHKVLEHLASCVDDVARWERANGIALSRIDFERGDNMRVKWVEVYPLLEEEPEELVRDIAAATLQLMGTSREPMS